MFKTIKNAEYSADRQKCFSAMLMPGFAKLNLNEYQLPGFTGELSSCRYKSVKNLEWCRLIYTTLNMQCSHQTSIIQEAE